MFPQNKHVRKCPFESCMSSLYNLMLCVLHTNFCFWRNEGRHEHRVCKVHQNNTKNLFALTCSSAHSLSLFTKHTGHWLMMGFLIWPFVTSTILLCFGLAALVYIWSQDLLGLLAPPWPCPSFSIFHWWYFESVSGPHNWPSFDTKSAVCRTSRPSSYQTVTIEVIIRLNDHFYRRSSTVTIPSPGPDRGFVHTFYVLHLLQKHLHV